MDRVNSRISQVYGYAVCFITVVVMLIAIKQVVDAGDGVRRAVIASAR
jgi:hypothetical protein